MWFTGKFRCYPSSKVNFILDINKLIKVPDTDNHGDKLDDEKQQLNQWNDVWDAGKIKP